MSISLLEFVLGRSIGPPAFRSNDTSYWHCPEDGHDDSRPSLHTMPVNPEYKDRFVCGGCGAWGDEHDALKYGFPNRDFGWRESTLFKWFDAYRDEYPDGSTISFRGAKDSNKKPIKKESRKMNFRQREVRDALLRDPQQQFIREARELFGTSEVKTARVPKWLKTRMLKLRKNGIIESFGGSHGGSLVDACVEKVQRETGIFPSQYLDHWGQTQGTSVGD